MIRICEICRKVMDKKDYPHYSYLQFSSRRFCSKECHWKDDEYRNKVLKARKEKGITEEQIISCRKMGLANKGKNRSPETEFKSGEQNPNWKGGTDKYRGENWKKQRQKALERDKCCKRCDVNKDLNVHHIIPYRISKDSSLGNLITLCRRCHIIHERGYSTLIIDGEDILISNVPEKIVNEFYEFAEDEFDGNISMALKWLMDFRKGLLTSPNETIMEQMELMSAEIEKLKSVPVEQPTPKKRIIRSLAGTVIAEREE